MPLKVWWPEMAERQEQEDVSMDPERGICAIGADVVLGVARK